MENLLYIFHFVQNRPYSPYRHIFARIKVHGIKAMSRGDLVGANKWKVVNTSNRGRVRLFPQKETTILEVQNIQFKFRQVLLQY